MSSKTILFVFLIFFPLIISQRIPATVYLTGGSYIVEKNIIDPSGLAYGFYELSYESNGWDKLSLSINKNAPYTDYEKAYALGYLEGVLTFKRISDSYSNSYRSQYYYEKNRDMPQYMEDFFNKQRNWIQESFLKNQQVDLDFFF